MIIPVATSGLVILQLCGLPFLPIEHPSITILILGFMFVIIGTGISISARKTLGTNWTHAAEKQVKQRQVLVTTGIYSYVRHPIYFGNNLLLVGAELVASSYLGVIFLLIFFYDYFLAKEEEEILIKHFGNEYIQYKKKTRMLIPFIC